MSVSTEEIPWWIKITDCNGNSQLIRRAEIASIPECLTTTVITVRSGMQFETPDSYGDVEKLALADSQHRSVEPAETPK